MMTYEERYKNYRARIAAGMSPISLDHMSAEISVLADKIQNVINVAMQKEQFEAQLKAYHQALALQEWKEEIAKEEEDSNHTNQVIFSVAKVAVLGAVAFFAPSLLPTVAPFVGAVGSASNMIATGLICGATDAAVQGVAVDLGLQSRFSVNELLETTFTSGVGSGTGGLNAIEQTAAVTATATGTQFTEIALGLKEKFEPQAVALQAASAAIARGLHEVLPSLNQTLGENNGSVIAKTAVHSAINSVLSHVVTGTPISIEQMATEISGKLIACKVGEALASNSLPKTKNTEVEKIDETKVSTPKLNPLQAQGLFGKSQIESTVNKAIFNVDWEKTKASMLECCKDNVDAVAALNIPSLDLSRIRGGDIRYANLPEVKPVPINSPDPDNAIAKPSTDMAQALDDAIKRAKMNPHIPHEEPLEPVYPELWLWGATDAAKLGVGLWKMAGSGASKVARVIGRVGSEKTEGVGKSTNALQAVLKTAKPTPGKPNQLEAVLDDGSKVIFRRDIGEHAHPIGKDYPNPIDHYNIEIQIPNSGKLGRFISKENVHIVVDENLQPIDSFLKDNTRIILNSENKNKLNL